MVNHPSFRKWLLGLSKALGSTIRSTIPASTSTKMCSGYKLMKVKASRRVTFDLALSGTLRIQSCRGYIKIVFRLLFCFKYNHEIFFVGVSPGQRNEEPRNALDPVHVRWQQSITIDHPRYLYNWMLCCEDTLRPSPWNSTKMWDQQRTGAKKLLTVMWYIQLVRSGSKHSAI